MRKKPVCFRYRFKHQNFSNSKFPLHLGYWDCNICTERLVFEQINHFIMAKYVKYFIKHQNALISSTFRILELQHLWKKAVFWEKNLFLIAKYPNLDFHYNSDIGIATLQTCTPSYSQKGQILWKTPKSLQFSISSRFRILGLQHLLSLIHIWRCRRIERCRSRWSPYH